MLLCFRHSPKSFVSIGSLTSHSRVMWWVLLLSAPFYRKGKQEQKFTDLPVATWKEERQDLNTAGAAPNARLLTTVHPAF